MNFLLLSLLVAFAGCSSDVVPATDSAEDDKPDVFAAVEQFLGNGEVVRSVVIDRNPGRKLSRPQYTVRSATKIEQRGGREFRVYFDETKWVVEETGYRWLKFDRVGPRGVVQLSVPIDIATAARVLSYVRPQLTEGEYVAGLRECLEIESSVNDIGERILSGSSEVEGCVEVSILRGPGFAGRILGIDVLGEEYTVVRRGTISW